MPPHTLTFLRAGPLQPRKGVDSGGNAPSDFNQDHDTVDWFSDFVEECRRGGPQRMRCAHWQAPTTPLRQRF
jgi:hypothetical protein